MLQSQVPAYYSDRRKRLVAKYPGVGFLVPSAPETIRNSDVHHPYRQESHFYYLSGFDEPNSCLLVLPGRTTGESHRFVLFVQERNEAKEIWAGERYGLDRARTVFEAHETYPYSQLEQKLPELLKDVDSVYYSFGIHKEIDQVLHRVLEAQKVLIGRVGRGFLPIFDSGPAIGEMRLRKDANDLSFLRKACEITAKGHLALMQQVRPGMNEREVQALIDYVFIKEGCERLGYPSIVAGGSNATCLHYTRNNEILKAEDLLLVDAGGEFGYYTSDITRTFPIGRKFSAAQSDIYEIVLASQKKAIHMSKPGTTLLAIHECVIDALIDGLLSLGLLQGSKDQIIEEKLYTRLYPHKTSHWLGMDVHDVGLYLENNRPRALEAGMVFTIEPGLYCQPNDEKLPSEFRGIGVRIEDDILVTPQGCENLTVMLPREKKDIEEIRSAI